MRKDHLHPDKSSNHDSHAPPDHDTSTAPHRGPAHHSDTPQEDHGKHKHAHGHGPADSGRDFVNHHAK